MLILIQSIFESILFGFYSAFFVFLFWIILSKIIFIPLKSKKKAIMIKIMTKISQHEKAVKEISRINMLTILQFCGAIISALMLVFFLESIGTVVINVVGGLFFWVYLGFFLLFLFLLPKLIIRIKKRRVWPNAENLQNS